MRCNVLSRIGTDLNQSPWVGEEEEVDNCFEPDRMWWNKKKTHLYLNIRGRVGAVPSKLLAVFSGEQQVSLSQV